MRTLVAGLFGVLFGAGLALAGMTDPARVLNFLDLFGTWDPTLACVLGGAVATSSLGFALGRRRAQPWLGGSFALPTRKDVDGRLVGGAALFGVGWGLAGLCPGPALANLGRPSAALYVFVAAMVAGILLQRWTERRSAATHEGGHVAAARG